MEALIKEYNTVHEIYSQRLRQFGLPAPKPHPEAVLRTLSVLQYDRLSREIHTMRKSLSVMRRECTVCRMVAKYVIVPATLITVVVVLLNILP